MCLKIIKGIIYITVYCIYIYLNIYCTVPVQYSASGTVSSLKTEHKPTEGHNDRMFRLLPQRIFGSSSLYSCIEL